MTETPDLTTNKLFNLKGKVAVITGAGTGLGYMMATCFVQNGAKVYIASRKLKNLTAAADHLNSIRSGSCIPLQADLSSKAGCDDLANQIKSRESSLDILINNSGLSWGAPLDQTEESRGWDRIMSVNVKSLFYLTVALVPLLEKGKDAYNTASVINISSIYGTYPNAYMPTNSPGTGAYSYPVSKAAASHLTKVMSVSLMAKHITVNAIAPGFFPSQMTLSNPNVTGVDKIMHDSHLSKRMGRAEDITSIALLMATNSHLTGTIIPIDGGMGLAKIPDEIASYYKPARDENGRARL